MYCPFVECIYHCQEVEYSSYALLLLCIWIVSRWKCHKSESPPPILRKPFLSLNALSFVFPFLQIWKEKCGHHHATWWYAIFVFGTFMRIVGSTTTYREIVDPWKRLALKRAPVGVSKKPLRWTHQINELHANGQHVQRPPAETKTTPLRFVVALKKANEERRRSPSV